jgi:hypothetical protein
MDCKEEEYYKIINPDMNHQGITYKKGPNTLRRKFNDDPRCTRCADRMYFTTKEHITKFFGCGTWLAKIKLPKNDPEFRMIEDPEGDKWGTNMFIIEELYSLFETKTYEMIGLNITDNVHIVKWASYTGNIDFLNWWLSNSCKIQLKYSDDLINDLCYGPYKNTTVLKWWLDSGLDYKFNKHSLKSINDQEIYKIVNVEQAFNDNDIEILDKLIKSRRSIKYNKDTLKLVLEKSNRKMLNYWRNNIRHFRIN